MDSIAKSYYCTEKQLLTIFERTVVGDILKAENQRVVDQQMYTKNAELLNISLLICFGSNLKNCTLVNYELYFLVIWGHGFHCKIQNYY